ncbi:MAG TPA: DinB family protein [Chitinophagaceae bacterium]|nr:DinB family protein [Chitinophagaceae bacterium]
MEEFKLTIDFWISELKKYDLDQLCTRPSAESWSLGQLYIHLINDTTFFIEQVKTCVSTNDNESENALPFAKKIFLENEFPNEVIIGAPSNALIPQPENKEQLIEGLVNLKKEIIKAENLISRSKFKGKTKHPGLDYFSAMEWLRFGELHFHHHLRQKKRIDMFLKKME